MKQKPERKRTTVQLTREGEVVILVYLGNGMSGFVRMSKATAKRVAARIIKLVKP